MGLHGAGVDPRPEGASLLCRTPGSTFSVSVLQRQSTSQGNMGDSEPPDILYERLVLVDRCLYHSHYQSTAAWP